MSLSRRALIKQASAAALAFGLTDLTLNSGVIGPQAKTYAQALAQSSGRKLALLIGIDKYPEEVLSGDRALNGCATDVQLQKALLIYRFGFLPEDIVCLTNQQATRSGIYQAFIDHLYAQAKSDDTVVFHFSGYGAQVRVEDPLGGQETVRSLVPYDGLLPTEARPALNDISEVELKSLLKQLKTRQITTVLDVGFVNLSEPVAGGLRSRARSAVVTGQPPTPFPLLTEKQPLKASDPFPGILFRGAAVDEVAIERQWNGFYAGAFTYVLTQYLWTAPAPVTVGRALGRSQETLLRWGGSNQQPVASSDRKLDLRTPEKTPPVYSTPLLAGTRGQGTVQSITPDGGTATLWLGGLPPRVLEYIGSATVMSCNGRQLKLKSRKGLTSSAKVVDLSASDAPPIQPGAPVFESVRMLPKNINLVVSIDRRLERIERVDATSALSALAFVNSTSDTELPADCLLAKFADNSSTTLTASLSPQKIAQTVQQPEPSSEELDEPRGNAGYGLFSLTRSLIPGTLALQEEAIKPAINRLTPKLQSLLALKMLRLSENRACSQLPVRVSLEQVSPDEQLLISRQTFQIGQAPTQQNVFGREGFTPEVSVGSRVRYRLFNDGEQPLYYTLINVDPRERLSAFCPIRDLSAPAPEDGNETQIAGIAATAIAPGSSTAIPSANTDWSVKAPPGPVETYVVCSTRPLTRTFNTLLTVSASSGNQRISPLPDPLAVIEALLNDISVSSRSSDSYTLNVSQWATLNFTYQSIG
ncbi:MAG: caspase family protein [Phormidesmis sp.]